MKTSLPEMDMKKFRGGDAEQIEIMFTFFYPSLCWFCNSIVKDEDDAKDIVNGVFEMVLGRKEKIGTVGNLKAFLYLSARNKCFNLLRMRNAHNRGHAEIAYMSPAGYEDNTINKMIKAEVLAELFTLINTLPKKRQLIFKLAYLQEVPNEKIAKLLNVSIFTVKTQKARAILMLKKGFARLTT